MSEYRTKCNNYGLLSNSYYLLFPRNPTIVSKNLFLVIQDRITPNLWSFQIKLGLN